MRARGLISATTIAVPRSLSGASVVLVVYQAFIVTVSPSVESVGETISTLQFADRAKKVVIETTVNRHAHSRHSSDGQPASAVNSAGSPGADTRARWNQEYEAEILELKTQLHEALAAQNERNEEQIQAHRKPSQHSEPCSNDLNRGDTKKGVDHQNDGDEVVALRKENSDLRNLLARTAGEKIADIPKLVRTVALVFCVMALEAL